MAKLKLKTKKSAAKRFKFTGSGKIKRKKANMRHIMTKMSPGKKRGLRSSGLIAKADEKSVKQMLPNSL